MATVTRIQRHSILLLALLGVTACGGEGSGPEEQVRAWLAAVEEAAESKQRSEIMSRISEAYGDARGNNRDDIEKLLRVYYLRSEKVGFVTKIDELSIVGDTAANVMLTVAMAGTYQSKLGFRADAYQFELELEADGDDWKLISARWGELGEQLR